MKSNVLRVAFLLGAAAIVHRSGVGQPSLSPRDLAPHHKLALDIFKELIETNTSLEIGCSKAAAAMATRLRAAGFPETDIQMVGPQARHMNLVARYRGTGKRRPLLFIGHLDVVDALRNDWSIDPFTFLDSSGYFYGRGTTDMKNEDADLIANLIRLKQEGFSPDRDIIVALTEDEENGDANGVQWLIRNRRDLIDAEYCINPDAGGGELKNGEHIVMEIQTSEKIYIDYQLEAKNKGGHSSLPVRDNAIYHLAGGLARVADLEFPLRLNETTRMFFERSSSRAGGQTGRDMMAVSRVPFDSLAAERLAASSPYYNSLMRTTVVATMVSGGHANNALPQSARAVVNCRMLPDDNADSVIARLRAVVADTQVSVTLLYASAMGPLSPLRKDVIGSLERITASMWPGVIVTPVMSTGATDGKLLRLAGIPVYGVSGMFADIDDVRAHGKDERLGAKEFFEGVDFMYRFIKALTSGS